MSSNTPPTYYFTDIIFNPTFFNGVSSSYLTYPIAQGTETISTLKASNINLINDTLGIGNNASSNSVITIGSDSNAQTTIKGTVIGLLGSSTASGNLSVTQTLTANAYSISGASIPTLTKFSMNYYYNYPQTTSAALSVASKYLYSPSSNSSTSDGHYLQPGIYKANIHMYFYALGGPTYTGTFVLGVSTGTAIQTMPVNSQYGTLNISTSDITLANNAGTNFNGNCWSFSHTGCFTLSSLSFVNLEFNLKTLTITSGTLTFNLYGCIQRIG